MAVFAYKAMNAHGRVVRGEMDALNLADLEARLKRIELDFINGRPLRDARYSWTNSVPLRERIHFCFHLEQLLQAGVPLLDALADLRESTTHTRFRHTIAALIESIQGGRSFSQALEAQQRVFDGVFRASIEAGETSGRLPAVLHSLAEALKREDELKAYARRIFIYPALVLCVTLSAVVVSLVYVVPELARLLQSTGMDLPLQTRILLAVSGFMQGHGWLLLGALICCPLVLAALTRGSPEARQAWDRMRLGIPVAGEVYHKIILSRFAALFAMMYASGIAIVDIVRAARQVVGNREVSAGLERVERMIAEGQSLSAAFHGTQLFPALVIRMLRVGEQTGSLDRALQNISYFYERDVRESIQRLQAVAEPLLIVVLGAVMLWIAMSVLGPIYDVIAHMKV